MISSMRGLRFLLQVLQPVIKVISIDVMDNLAVREWTYQPLIDKTGL